MSSFLCFIHFCHPLFCPFFAIIIFVIPTSNNRSSITIKANAWTK